MPGADPPFIYIYKTRSARFASPSNLGPDPNVINILKAIFFGQMISWQRVVVRKRLSPLLVVLLTVALLAVKSCSRSKCNQGLKNCNVFCFYR